MVLKRRLVAFPALVAALAVGAPAASATAAPIPARGQDSGSPSCPSWYAGPTNLATGCPFWLMS